MVNEISALEKSSFWLIHVVDIADPLLDKQIESVEQILKEMALDVHERIILLNKADIVDETWQQHLCERYSAYAVSAMEPKTLRPILQLIERRLWRNDELDDVDNALNDTENFDIEIIDTEPR